MSVQGPPDGPGGSGPPGTSGVSPPPARPAGTSQPLRAALVVVVAVAIAVGVLVRMGPAHSSASPPRTTRPAAVSTTLPRATTTPAVVTTTTTSTTAVPPSTVTVLVLNGWTTRHAALYFQKKLAADGYDTLAPNNALDETNTTTSVFVVAPADSATGTAIAELLGLSPSAVVVPSASNDSAIPAGPVAPSRHRRRRGR